jgi:hypothetical protein
MFRHILCVSWINCCVVFRILELQLLEEHGELLPARDGLRDQMNSLKAEEESEIRSKRDRVLALNEMIQQIRDNIGEFPSSGGSGRKRGRDSMSGNGVAPAARPDLDAIVKRGRR